MRRTDINSNCEVLRQMPQLDGLRAIAVFMVFYQHWMPKSYHFRLPWGEWGVDFFFVLSGFLISGILLNCRKYIDEGGGGVTSTAIRFYVRRALRIFPLYYLLLLLIAVSQRHPHLELTPWLWTYTVNIYRVFIDDEWEDSLSHFWSLSVEEQFYLIWPLVILLAPRQHLLKVIIFAIFTGLATKLTMALNGFPDRSIRYFTLSCFDGLAFGGVLAFFVQSKGLSAINKNRMVKWIFSGSLSLLISLLWFRVRGNMPFVPHLLLRVSSILVFGWLVVKAAHGFGGVAGRLFNSIPLTYLGKISYGLYLIHKLVPPLLEKIGVPIAVMHPLLTFLIFSAITITFASISWHFFEAPLNGLKRYFPYQERIPAPVLSH